MEEGKFPKITDEGVAQLRSRIGIKVEKTIRPWCSEATFDNIWHYAHGIGDDNPLWCDPAYAATTKHGGIVALPSFLFACDRIVSGYVGGLPGIHAMWGGANWKWHRYLRRNEAPRTDAFLSDVIIRDTKFSGRAVQQIYTVRFFGGNDDLIAECDSWCFRTERDLAREGQKYAELWNKPLKRYSAAELETIYAHYACEKIRGAIPRYWEDVKVGQRLPTMLKGPMTATGFIAYIQGWGALYIHSSKLAWKMTRDHPALGIPNKFGIPDCPERVHWEEEFAQRVGVPRNYDYGPERCSWLTHQLTNWIGDDGFLLSSSCKLRRHNFVGDVLYINGRISKKYVANGKCCIEVTQEARNQDEELSAVGTCVAELPLKRKR